MHVPKRYGLRRAPLLDFALAPRATSKCLTCSGRSSAPMWSKRVSATARSMALRSSRQRGHSAVHDVLPIERALIGVNRLTSNEAHGRSVCPAEMFPRFQHH